LAAGGSDEAVLTAGARLGVITQAERRPTKNSCMARACVV